MRPPTEYDFTDYLDLRRARDLGRLAGAELAGATTLLASLERALPVPFASTLPDMRTYAVPDVALPRGLRPEDVAIVFRLREHHACLGEGRFALAGVDLPEGEALKDWLDFIETEREAFLTHRQKLRKMDAKLYGIFTGLRTNPKVAAAAVLPDERRGEGAFPGRAGVPSARP